MYEVKTRKETERAREGENDLQRKYEQQIINNLVNAFNCYAKHFYLFYTPKIYLSFELCNCWWARKAHEKQEDIIDFLIPRPVYAAMMRHLKLNIRFDRNHAHSEMMEDWNIGVVGTTAAFFLIEFR